MKDGLLQETEIRSFNWGTDDADIDYATIYENRYKILRMAFSRFSAKSEDFLAFTEKSDRWLSDYSLYTALKRHFGDIEWQSWDVPLRDRDHEGVKEYQEILHNDIMFCKFCQYEFFKQWMQLKQYANSRGVQIIGDMPLYVASDSVDVWAHREMFLLEPDPLCKKTFQVHIRVKHIIIITDNIIHPGCHVQTHLKRTDLILSCLL